MGEVEAQGVARVACGGQGPREVRLAMQVALKLQAARRRRGGGATQVPRQHPPAARGAQGGVVEVT